MGTHLLAHTHSLLVFRAAFCISSRFRANVFLKKEKEKRTQVEASPNQQLSEEKTPPALHHARPQQRHQRRGNARPPGPEPSAHPVRGRTRVRPVPGKHPIRNVLAHPTTDLEVSQLQKLLEIPRVLVQPAVLAMHSVPELPLRLEAAERVHGVRHRQ